MQVRPGKLYLQPLCGICRDMKGFEIIIKICLQRRGQCLDDVFWGLNDFKDNEAAEIFFIRLYGRRR